MNTEKMKQQLLERLEENNSDFYAGLLSKDRQELIDNAPQGWGEGKSQIVFAQPVRKRQQKSPSLKSNFSHRLSLATNPRQRVKTGR